ncbi:MAG: CBS domain-containing protein [Acidimicrobiales bacterium]
MTPNPATVAASDSIADAARRMKAENIGDVLVVRDERVCGLVTDRDIVVRVVAEGRDIDGTRVEEICSGDLVCLTPQDTVEDAVRVMAERAVRRLPIAEGGRPLGVVSIGDLAIEREGDSVLADISVAPPNR